MPIYKAPVEDVTFLLNDVFQIDRYDNLPGFSDASADVRDAILGEAAKLSEQVLQPLNRVGDLEGCKRHEDGSVSTPKGFKAAFKQVAEGGWLGLSAPTEYGGQGLPVTLTQAVTEFQSSANMAFTMYPMLTQGAIAAIRAVASPEQQQRFIPPMIDGRWTGTMNLTEPHCGTDLGLLRTRAEPQADGTYRITGTKIFISSGEHDLTENIIHLVLAKLPDSPDSVKGISLFIVPKVLVNPDGSLGARNAVSCGSIEEKMGIHGNATCVMNYDGATGWLLGDLHKGMKAMFTMMNEARLGVGLQGYAVAEAAYQNALAYAKDRLQGRDVTGAKNPAGPADPLIVHPDIRRNLMDQKSLVEGARAFTFWAAHLIDRSVRQGDEAAEGLVSLLIPVLKGFQTDKGFEMAVQAQQIWGGHGYIEDNGVSQFVRDARIAMIYEGANGVQALDLVGRKLAQDGGKHVLAFFDLVKGFLKENEGDGRMKPFLDPLKRASKDVQAAAMFFMQHAVKTPNAALAGSYDFMLMMGHACLGLMWARIARAAFAGLDAGGDAAFLEAKLATGRYYMARHLPATAMHLARIESGADPVMALAPEAF